MGIAIFSNYKTHHDIMRRLSTTHIGQTKMSFPPRGPVWSGRPGPTASNAPLYVCVMPCVFKHSSSVRNCICIVSVCVCMSVCVRLYMGGWHLIHSPHPQYCDHSRTRNCLTLHENEPHTHSGCFFLIFKSSIPERVSLPPPHLTVSFL